MDSGGYLGEQTDIRLKLIRMKLISAFTEEGERSLRESEVRRWALKKMERIFARLKDKPKVAGSDGEARFGD